MSAPQRSDYPNSRSGAIRYRRALREYEKTELTKSVASKDVLEGARNDRGINIGDLKKEVVDGQVQYRSADGAAGRVTRGQGGKRTRSGGMPTAAVTAGGNKFFPLKSGNDVIYRQASDDPNPVRPSQPPTPDQEPDLSETATAVTADETRLNDNGMVQTGRNMSTLNRGDDNMAYIQGKGGLLDRVGLGADATLNTGWASNQLPGTASALYGGKPETRGFDSDGIGINTGAERQQLSKNLYQDGGAVTFGGEGREGLSGLSDKQRSMPSSEGESGGGQRNWMEKGPEDAKMARRRAFLDAPSSMAGMRAVDAQLGRVRAGGDYHYINPNKGQEGEPEFIKVSTETARAHQNGQLSGQQVLSKHMDRVIQNNPGAADSPSPAEFSPDMSEEQFSAFQAKGGSQKGFTPDMEEEDFITMQKS